MIATIRSLSKGGNGIVLLSEGVCFVPYVLPEETVEIEIFPYKKNLWKGELKKVIHPSPFRREPLCKFFGSCGGCNWQHISYEKQLEYKKEILLYNLKKITSFPIKDINLQLIASPHIVDFRSKVRFRIQNRKIGFLKKESHQLQEIDYCPIINQVSNQALSRARKSDLSSNELIIITNGQQVLTSQDEKDRYLDFFFSNFSFSINCNNFIQSNLFLLQTMLRLLTDFVSRIKPESVTELFSGAGFFSIPLARLCKRLFAYEIEPANIRTMHYNLKKNSVTNISIIQADLNQSPIKNSDLIVVDPPRGGISRKLAAQIASGCQAIAYFSCDSATFSRDLSYFLSKDFQLEKLFLIDNFPHCDHFEIFAQLKK